jgi:peptidoglycan/xylan/chitin deacetylase (PgdA/CDA1 family)
MQAIKAVVGVTPTCWRPPYGDIDVRFMFLRLFGMPTYSLLV